MKAFNRLIGAAVLTTSLCFSSQSQAYVFGTDVGLCFSQVCADAYILLFPYDLPTVVAAGLTTTFTSSEWYDWDVNEGNTHLTNTTFIPTHVALQYPTGSFDIYYASTLHVFLEPDSNTFDEYSHDELIWL